MISFGLLLLVQVSAPAGDCDLGTSPSEVEVWQASAFGIESLSRGDVPRAVECLERAHAAAPRSAVIARDLALAYAQAERIEDALRLAEDARSLGDADPELAELIAICRALTDDEAGARAALEGSEAWSSDLIAASLGDRSALGRVSEWVGEPSRRGALASLVAATRAGQRGDRSDARKLIARAEKSAEKAGEAIVINAARHLRERLGGEGDRFRGGTRARLGVTYANNPGFQGLGAVTTDHAARLAVMAEGSVRLRLGTARLDAALRIDQSIHLNDRDRLSELDVTHLSAALAAEFPFGRSADAAVFGLGARFRDSFGDLFSIHYAYAIEGGPYVEFPFLDDLRVIVSVYGVVADFVDLSPTEEDVSSQNRDYFGQRAAVGFLWREDLVDLRVDAIFHRDNALGEAFDHRGGTLAGRARLRLPVGAVLSGGLAVSYRQYGPVGDEAIIGAAARRDEVRLVAELGGRVPISEHWSIYLEDVVVSNFARSPQSYAHHQLTSGVEVAW